MRYVLLTSKFCHKCPKMIELVMKSKLNNGEIIEAGTPESNKKIKEYCVFQAPTLILFDDDDYEKIRFNDVEVAESFLKTRGLI